RYARRGSGASRPARGRGARDPGDGPAASRRHDGGRDCPVQRLPSRAYGLRKRRQPPSSLPRQNDAGLADDAAVMLDSAVSLEMEDRLLSENSCVEISVRDDKLGILALRLRDDSAICLDPDSAGDQSTSV